MKFKYSLLFFAFIISTLSLVQAQDKEILFTVNESPVYTSEFVRVYNKNLDLVKDESQKDVDSYLELFINYKLKLEEAKRLSLDKKSSYLSELNGYKKQLAKNYVVDSKVTDALVNEAYSRLQTEINASHVLVRLDESATGKDTIEAYNQILKLRDRVISEGYKNVQKDVHNGNTIFAEDLGYFSAFKMVYPFETVAYNTNIGDVSQPFRTRFGYHIVTVFNKRKARGEVTVAHIMVKTNNENEDESKTKINEIYKRYQQGEAFDALAKQLSEDLSSSSNGGLLKPFSSGELSAPEFEEVVFNLKAANAVSKPFKTQFGWHIVKLISKKDIASFEEMKPQLQSKLKQDSRSKVISDSRIKVLKGKYAITENAKALDYFKTVVNQDYFTTNWRLPANLDSGEILFKIQDKVVTYGDFGKILSINQKSYKNNTTAKADVVLNTIYNSFLDSELLKYQEENLINENTDYAQIVSEYRDGLLLFDLMETEIWNVAKNDSIALENYFNANKNHYYFPERIDAVVASSAKKNVIKKVAKLMEKGSDQDTIKNLVNTNGQVNVSFSTGEMDKNHQALPKEFNFRKGVSKIFKHNDAYIVVKVNDVLPKGPKSFEEAKGKVTSDYQNYKEENWLKELAATYNVKVNQNVLNNVKQTLEN